MTVPVIAIDGPAASGKGTIAQRAADVLGWHYLDSGALYRLAALAALRAKVSFDDPAALTAAAQSLAPQFKDGRIWLDGEDVSEAIRAETVGVAASKCAAVPGCGRRFSTCSDVRRRLQDLLPTGATWGRWFFRKPNSRSL